MNLDLFLFQQINDFAGRYVWLDTLAIFFAQYFEWILLFCLILFLVKNFKKNLKMIIEAFFGAILAKEIFVDIIRQMFFRSRPFVENQIHSLIEHAVTSAFPSAHAAFYFAIGTIVYLYKKKAGFFFLLAAFFISLARVFAGLHWPSDILVGSLIGILSALIVNKVSKEFLLK
jgi:undecaprenyl-diphosphatase